MPRILQIESFVLIYPFNAYGINWHDHILSIKTLANDDEHLTNKSIYVINQVLQVISLFE